MMENKMFNSRIEFQQEIILQILAAYHELRQTITVRKSAKRKKKPTTKKKSQNTKKTPDII